MPRVTDIYAALPSITGKFELEYEGELRGAATVASDLISAAVSNVFNGYLDVADLRPVIEWFEMGGTLQVTTPHLRRPGGAGARHPGPGGRRRAARRETDAATPCAASAIDFVLEGLHAQKKITRSEEWRYAAPEGTRRPPRPEQAFAEPRNQGGGKKKYDN